MAIKAHPAAKCPNYTHKKFHVSPSTWPIPWATFIKPITVIPAAVASTDFFSLISIYLSKHILACTWLHQWAVHPEASGCFIIASSPPAEARQPSHGIFTRPTRASSSHSHSIFTVFHLLLNFREELLSCLLVDQPLVLLHQTTLDCLWPSLSPPGLCAAHPSEQHLQPAKSSTDQCGDKTMA